MIEIEEKNRILDTENKANRATLQQMSNQLSSYENGNYNHRQQLDSLRAERDAALHEKETIKQELELVKSRLDSIQKAWQNSRTELDSRETKFSASELQLRQIENELSYAKSCLDAFKQQIAQLLSDGYVKVEAKEEEIKEKVQLLMQSSKDRGIVRSLSFRLNVDKMKDFFVSVHHESTEPEGTIVQTIKRSARNQLRTRQPTQTVRSEDHRTRESTDNFGQHFHYARSLSREFET